MWLTVHVGKYIQLWEAGHSLIHFVKYMGGLFALITSTLKIRYVMMVMVVKAKMASEINGIL